MKLLNEITSRFQTACNPLIAAKQQAYMRDQFPFLGLKTVVRRELQKAVFRSYPVQHESRLLAMLQQLWEMPEREYQYCAIDLAKFHLKRLSLDTLDLFEQMIRRKSWWDTVDDIAINLIGRLLGKELTLMDQWIQDPYLWIRRSAIISQIKRKKSTDTQRLFSYCEQTAHETDFFIRKAIGWALREYSKHNAEAIALFLKRCEGKLSGLSVREASKYL